jgi:YidC/Oxa1 family membrane protein insertase
VNIFELLVVQPIFNLLIGLYSIIPGGDFGVAIIVFTVIVRFMIYPLTRSMLHQSRTMQKLQPELVKIKKNANGNRQLEAMQMMELYKRHNVSPFRSIGILFIQLPIFIALYQVIQIFTMHRDQIEKFTYDFLENIPAIHSLIQDPGSFNEKLLNVVDLVKPAIQNGRVDMFLVLLALIAGVTQYVMSKQTMPQKSSNKRLRDIMSEAAEGKEANQSEINAIVMSKMSKFLPVMMFFVMISVPGALALYYATSNIVAVIQQHGLLKKDEEELEDIAEHAPTKPVKSAAIKTREKAAKEATVTRIVAKDSRRKK